MRRRSIQAPCATAFFTGLTPDFVGLYQINVTIPPGIQSGTSTMSLLLVDNVASTSVQLAVRMTDRLYYQDSYLTEFRARVVDVSPDRRRVYLDRTAFYPTSGGQPFDTGELGGMKVIEVIDEGDRIAHVLTRAAYPDRRRRPDRSGAPLRSHAATHRPASAFGRGARNVRRAHGQFSLGRGIVHHRC